MNKNLTAKEKLNLLENYTPVEYVLRTDLFDNTLTDRVFRIMRPFQWLHNRAQHLRGFGGKHVFFRDVKGQRKSVTQYHFIINGLPHIQKGLKGILNIKNDEERYVEMIRFEAIVRLTCLKSVKYYELTEDMIAEHVRQTDMLEPPYDEERWTFELKSIFGSDAATVGARANDYSKTLGFPQAA